MSEPGPGDGSVEAGRLAPFVRSKRGLSMKILGANAIKYLTVAVIASQFGAGLMTWSRGFSAALTSATFRSVLNAADTRASSCQ